MAEPTQIAEIISLTTLTPHTTELVLRPIEHPLSFKPGQWISLQLPVGDHPPLNRAYSLAEPPSTAGHLTLLFDHVVLPDSEPQHLLLIGRYSGLVPLRCMLRALAGHGSLPSSTLIAQAPTTAEQLYHEEFMALAASQSNFRYLPFVNEGPESNAETVDVIKQIAGNGRRVTPMIAGVKAFARPLRALLMELGFDRREVKLETYD